MEVKQILIRATARVVAELGLDQGANLFLERLIYRDCQPAISRGGPGRFSRHRRFQVLMFHKISSDAHPFFAPLDPLQFERQLLFLKRCFQVMDLEELVEHCRRNDLPERAVAITLDDGYRDNYTQAFPLLRKHALPATLFVTTGSVGNSRVLWHDRVFDAFRYTKAQHCQFKRMGNTHFLLDSVAAKRECVDATISFAKSLPGPARLAFVEEIEDALQPDLVDGRTPMLSWTEIKEMRAGGIRIGSHTRTHPILSRIDAVQLRDEIFESKSELESQLRERVTGFAYPNGRLGDYGVDAVNLLGRAGYRYAVTTQAGFNTVDANPFELKRGQPWQTDMELFRFAFFLQRHGLQRPSPRAAGESMKVIS